MPTACRFAHTHPQSLHSRTFWSSALVTLPCSCGKTVSPLDMSRVMVRILRLLSRILGCPVCGKRSASVCGAAQQAIANRRICTSLWHCFGIWLERSRRSPWLRCAEAVQVDQDLAGSSDGIEDPSSRQKLPTRAVGAY